MPTVHLHVNDEDYQVEISVDDTPLLFVLRNELGLTAAKLGCGGEQCGACTVLVNGRTQLCCATPAGQFEGCHIETVEGVVASGEADAVRAALAQHSAAQCGYCTPGIMMTLIALSRRKTALSLANVRAALEPHLCRCGTHVRVLRAAATMFDNAARPRW
jgi:nicotinate dehydrogenase subunit A